MTDHLCVACVKRSRRHHSQTCDACPRIIERNLRELRDLSPLLSAAITPGQGGVAGPHVSGSREAPVPVLLHVVDLAAEARGGTVADRHGDQTGALPIATVLDQWVQDWREQRGKGERRPVPTVPALAQWLLTRVDDACDTHPGLDEFAAEVWQMVVQVRVALDISRTPISMAAPCPRCEMFALKRDVGDEWVVCRGCGTMLSEDEYRWHARVTVGEVAA